ncbi:MAG: SHOCT domain-containing protein [Thermoplasmataceae archaeon]
MNENPKLSSIKTELLVALIFLVITVIGTIIFAAMFILFLIFALSVAPNYPVGGPPPFFIILGLFGLIFAIPSIIILIRTKNMLNAANNGDITTLKEKNSIAVAIIALIFTGIIPGIMLLIAHGEINSISNSNNNMDPVTRLDDLKKMYDETLITKEEYDIKKIEILKNVNPKVNYAEDLRKLNKLLEEGAITNEEYDRLKRQIISKV